MPYKSGFGPFAGEIYRAPMSYPYRDGLSGADAAKAALLQIEKQVGAANLAAVIIEPIQGEGGFIVPAAGLPARDRRLVQANEVVFIADEIQTGFARTGAMFACEHEGVVPDLITTAKGIAGGLPLAAVTGRAEIMDATHVGGLGGTYGGNPVACAAAVAALDAFEHGGLIERAQQIEAIALARLTEAQGQRPADRRGARPRRHDGHRDRRPDHRRPDAGLDRRRGQGCPRAGRDRADLWHLRQRDPAAAAAVHPRPPADRGPRRAAGRPLACHEAFIRHDSETDHRSTNNLPAELPTGLLIDGEWTDAADGQTVAVSTRRPAT